MVPPGKPVSRLQRARLHALSRLIPGIQAFTLVDVVLLALYYWTSVDQTFLVSWSLAMLVWCLGWLAVVRQADLTAFWTLTQAVGEAILFSVFFVVVLPQVGLDRAVILVAFAAGLIAAGGLCRMAYPPAMLASVVLLILGSCLGILGSKVPEVWIPLALLGGFGAAITFLGKVQSGVFDARFRAEEDLDRQKTLVSHLLTDFEESASEGLWETDAEGRVTMVSPRLAKLFSVAAEALIGQPLAARTEIGAVLDRRLAFRGLVVPVEIGGQRRWWSLTGKPLKDETGRLTGWRGVGSDITGVRLQELEMLRLSQYDHLTGLLNRRSFRRHLDDLFAVDNQDKSRCLVLVDLIGFKDVNESRGHAFGDALLQAVADRLHRALPESVMVARLDGDEFALLAPAIPQGDDVLANLGRILEHLTQPYQLAGHRFEAGFQMGVSFAPQDARSADQWLRCADLALRMAKSGEKNRIVSFVPDMMDLFRLRNGLREDLRGGLDRREFSLAYQPLVDLTTGRINGFEALLRWSHPGRGSITPEVFIPLAEESGDILSLGLWVLEEACREASRWPQEISVSVNVSGVQLRTGNLDDDVGKILGDLGFDPRRLVLELTESALIKDDKTVGQTLAALKRRGIRLALDDFGTGYSSLSYLQSFPFDKLKIDQSFVRALAARESAMALLGAIVTLARSLGLSTTAEGIEDQEHRETLTTLGCDEGQGYLFSRPVPAGEVTELLATTAH